MARENIAFQIISIAFTLTVIPAAGQQHACVLFSSLHNCEEHYAHLGLSWHKGGPKCEELDGYHILWNNLPQIKYKLISESKTLFQLL